MEIVCAGPELDGEAAALAVAPPADVVPRVANELELPDEQPVSASRAAVPQAAIAAPALAIPRLLIIVSFRPCVSRRASYCPEGCAHPYFARNLLLLYFAAVQI